MRTWISTTPVAVVAAAAIAPSFAGSTIAVRARDEKNAASVKRLDGTTITAAEIDATVARLLAAAKVTGAGIAILADEKIAYLKAYGLRDKDKNLPLTADSVMTAASLSKVAFAYLVMQLVEEGVLRLDKPVYE
jgi:CubicO group peptidase (beta-lactamase class C family)